MDEQRATQPFLEHQDPEVLEPSVPFLSHASRSSAQLPEFLNVLADSLNGPFGLNFLPR